MRYHENGKPHVVAFYVRGVRNGRYRETTEDGRYRRTCTFRQGKLFAQLTDYVDDVPTLAVNFDADGTSFSQRTRAEIRQTMAKLLAAPAPADIDPMDAERFAALKQLRAYRYLVGISFEGLTLDDKYNGMALAGAKLCEKIGHLDHTPKNPGLPEEDYKLGYAGTSQSIPRRPAHTTPFGRCLDG